MAYVMVSVDDDRAVARAGAAAFLGGMYGQDFDALIDRVALAGTTDEVVERLTAFVRAGARHLVILPCSPRDRGGIDRLVDEVVPELRDRLGAMRAP